MFSGNCRMKSAAESKPWNPIARSPQPWLASRIHLSPVRAIRARPMNLCSLHCLNGNLHPLKWFAVVLNAQNEIRTGQSDARRKRGNRGITLALAEVGACDGGR